MLGKPQPIPCPVKSYRVLPGLPPPGSTSRSLHPTLQGWSSYSHTNHFTSLTCIRPFKGSPLPSNIQTLLAWSADPVLAGFCFSLQPYLVSLSHSCALFLEQIKPQGLCCLEDPFLSSSPHSTIQVSAGGYLLGRLLDHHPAPSQGMMSLLYVFTVRLPHWKVSCLREIHCAPCIPCVAQHRAWPTTQT